MSHALQTPKLPKRSRNPKVNPTRSVSMNLTRTTSIENESTKPSYGIISSITGVKDALVNYVMGKQTKINSKPEILRKQPSTKSSYEMDLHILNGEKEIISDDYFLAVMKENARLRSQMLKMRQSLPPNSPSKDQFSTVKHNIQTHNLRLWMDKQACLVKEPESIVSSETGENDDVNYSDIKKLAKTSSIAAAVAAGITAANQVTSKRKHKAKVEYNQVNHKITRDDSGVKLTAPNTREPSRDTFSPKNFVKPNLAQMKQENDKLAKTLGLI